MDRLCITRIIITLVGLLTAIGLSAQSVMHGYVRDMATEKPVSGASVVVKGTDGKIKKFATTKSDGSFNLATAPQKGYRIEVSAMSYKRMSLVADSVSYPLTVNLEPGGIQLKEVAVKAARIREQGDTITYNVGTFAQKQDRSIGDVLKRMPGIDVDKQGKIKYQGEDINKFYVEGSDLLGGRYGVATEGINHDDVGAVEVMENHQPLQVLSGISFSDRAAINLKLKEKAKATLSTHGSVGGGYSWMPDGMLWSADMFAMAIMPTYQSMTTVRTNNTGKSLRNMLIDFFGSSGGTGLSRYVGISLPGVPSLNSARTLFNRSVAVSVNNLKKYGTGEFKANIDYFYDRLESSSRSATTYFMPDGGSRIITEDMSGRQYSNSLSGNFIFEINRRKTFLNNTLKTNISWDRISLLTAGTLPNSQKAHLPDYSITNNFRMINRVKEKHLITFESRNGWESIPQTLDITMADGSMRQRISDHAFQTNETVSYSFTLNGLSVGLDGGISAYFRSMENRPPELPAEIPTLTESAISTNRTSVSVTPKLEYWINRVDIKLNLPLTYSRYTFDKAMANRNEGYFSPSLTLDWKPGSHFQGSLHGSVGRTPINLNLIHPDPIMTDYRTLRAGVDNFYNSTSQSVSASFNYKHVRRGLFADGRITHSWSHIPYTLSQMLLGDYIIYSYSDARNDGHSLSAYASLGKTLNFMRGSLNVNGGFTRSQSHLLSEMQAVRSTSTGWNTGVRINGAASYWLSFDYSFRYSANKLTMNSSAESWLSSMENEINVTLTPHDKWQFRIGGEHYRNEITRNNYKNMALLDGNISFFPTKKIELAASITNLLNKKEYSYKTYSELSSFESLRHIRGREILLTITIRK